MANPKFMSRIAGRMSKKSTKNIAQAHDHDDDSQDIWDDAIEEMENLDILGQHENEQIVDDNDGMGDGLGVPTEYSAHVQIDIITTFEGTVSTNDLVSKIKSHLKEALKNGMQQAADEMSLQSTDVKVMPIKLDLSVLDGDDVGLNEDPESGDDDELDTDGDPDEDEDDGVEAEDSSAASEAAYDDGDDDEDD